MNPKNVGSNGNEQTQVEKQNALAAKRILSRSSHIFHALPQQESLRQGKLTKSEEIKLKICKNTTWIPKLLTVITLKRAMLPC